MEEGIIDGVDRRRIASGSPYEPIVGFSRALVAGPHVFRLRDGTDNAGRDRSAPDTYGQTRRVLEIILAALAEAAQAPSTSSAIAST
jgi:hypothetical protein